MCSEIKGFDIALSSQDDCVIWVNVGKKGICARYREQIKL
jgi:hypothetical protein